MFEIGLLSSFIAGLLAFISPCVLPLVPVYIGMMSSRAIYKNKSIKISERLYLFINSLFFVMGFSIIFIALGSTATFIGQVLVDYSSIISRIGGAILIIFGLHYIGLFKIKFLNLEKRFNMPGSIRSGFIGSFIFGIIFSFGWIPCVGPDPFRGYCFLQVNLIVSLRESCSWESFPWDSGIPFILASIFISFFSRFLKKLNRHLNLVSIISGIFIIALGIVFVTDSMIRIIGYLSRYIPILDKINF